MASDSSMKQLQEHVSKMVSRGVRSPVEDAANERARASFNVGKLAEHVNGGADVIQKRYDMTLRCIVVCLTLN